ncbi:MAG: hypothetical protein R3297_05190 [Desulfobulbales bacterium]|nr:hypothetical protein [Desulfobulbales bacterium]
MKPKKKQKEKNRDEDGMKMLKRRYALWKQKQYHERYIELLESQADEPENLDLEHQWDYEI